MGIKKKLILTTLSIFSVYTCISFHSFSSFAFISDNPLKQGYVKFSELPASGVAVDFSDGTDYSKDSREPVESYEIGMNISANSVSQDGLIGGNSVVVYGATDSGQAVAQLVTSPFSQGIEKALVFNNEMELLEQQAAAIDPENFSNLVIAQVTNYVNVRSTPDENGEIVGKLYDDSVGDFLGEENGWYLIESGKVKGYVKAEYCVTGDDAIELAKTVGTRMATVTTTTLKVRADASTESEVLGLVPIEEDLSVIEELDGWVKVSIEEGEGFVSKDYVSLRTDFVKAESKEEEEARLKKEREAQLLAQAEAANARRQRENEAAQNTQNNSSSGKTYNPPTFSDNSMGSSVAKYACQFVGNPYVYGGSSLTNGTDCSGFVMSVYKAFGVSLPHSSTADRTQGYAVEGGMANAQPGDILCYSGHVALYIGNGQIVHASTSKTGIIISNANYRDILAVRRIF